MIQYTEYRLKHLIQSLRLQQVFHLDRDGGCRVLQIELGFGKGGNTAPDFGVAREANALSGNTQEVGVEFAVHVFVMVSGDGVEAEG